MKISVITVCRNAELTIARTLHSIFAQTYKDLEFILIDGASTDKTLEIAKQYQDKISLLVSEKDLGIYDAMNKGIAGATGEVLYFLNADDILLNEKILEDFMNVFEKRASKVLYGNAIILNPADNKETLKSYFEPLNKIFFFCDTICHQSAFIRRSLFEQYGMYDLNYKIASDYEWFLRVWQKESAFFHYLDRDTAVFSLGGQSGNKKNDLLLREERKKVILKYYTGFEITLCRLKYRYYQFLFLLYYFIFSRNRFLKAAVIKIYGFRLKLNLFWKKII